jgi:hypothetical protein
MPKNSGRTIRSGVFYVIQGLLEPLPSSTVTTLIMLVCVG